MGAGEFLVLVRDTGFVQLAVEQAIGLQEEVVAAAIEAKGR